MNPRSPCTPPPGTSASVKSDWTPSRQVSKQWFDPGATPSYPPSDCLTPGHLSPSLDPLAPVLAVLHVNLADKTADPDPAQLPGDPRRHVECGCGRTGLSSGEVILSLVMG